MLATTPISTTDSGNALSSTKILPESPIRAVGREENLADRQTFRGAGNSADDLI
jgi:hypothetical protein